METKKKDRAPEERFAYLIEKISRTTSKNVVVLVDEYDKPMLQAIGNETLLCNYRNIPEVSTGIENLRQISSVCSSDRRNQIQ